MNVCYTMMSVLVQRMNSIRMACNCPQICSVRFLKRSFMRLKTFSDYFCDKPMTVTYSEFDFNNSTENCEENLIYNCSNKRSDMGMDTSE